MEVVDVLQEHQTCLSEVQAAEVRHVVEAGRLHFAQDAQGRYLYHSQ
jgi:hypothetical protein